MKKICAILLFVVTAAPAFCQDLLDIYDLALQNDPAIQEAEEKRNALLEARPQSLGRLLPTLTIVGGLNASRYDTTNTFTDQQLGAQQFWDSNVYLKLSQPIYHHDYWLQFSQSDNQIAEAEAEYVAEQQNLLIRTAKAYFAVLQAQSNLSFAQAEKETVAHQLQEMQRRLAVGSASLGDLQEAQAGYDQSHASEIDAERKLQASKTALAEIIGEADVELNRLREDIPLFVPEPNNLDKWLALSQQNNFTLIAAQHHAEVLRKEVDVQSAGHLPTLDLVGNVGTTDTDRPAGLVSNSQTIGVQLNVPLYMGGGVESKVRQAKHQFAAAKKAVDKQRRASERLAQDAYQGLEFSIHQIAALQSAQRSTQISVEAVQRGLRIGTRTIADLLNANKNFSRAQRDHAQARYDYVLNNLLLKQAAGALSRRDLEAINVWLN